MQTHGIDTNNETLVKRAGLIAEAGQVVPKDSELTPAKRRFRERFVMILEASGFKASDLAREWKCHPSYISHMKAGREIPASDLIFEKIAPTFNVQPGYFWDEQHPDLHKIQVLTTVKMQAFGR
jgi:hypothetical protein